MSARTCQRLCAVLLLCSLIFGTFAVLDGAPAWPFVALVVASSIAMQIAGRIARGIPVFAVGAEARQGR
ncbi:MAG: hypothetical protein JNK49_00300 [Planctomycetes bacterium]|nr:hypothetical protein [Planctomycetota bacterium]